MNHKSGKVIPLRPDFQPPGRDSRDLVVEWFRLHRYDLLRYARRILPASECPEDLVQNVFYRILKQENLETLRNPRAFLMTVARNAAIDRLRKIKAMPETGADPEEEQPRRSTLDEAEMIIAIERALKGLTERCRQVFVLRRFRGLETSAVAKALGISPRMVQKHLANALTHFHDQLDVDNRNTES